MKPKRYSIVEVARLTGISTATLRNWETRYGFPQPERGRNGYRVYSEADVIRLSEAARRLKLGERISSIVEAAIQTPEQMVPSRADATLSLEMRDYIERCYAAMLVFDETKALAMLGALSSHMTPAPYITQVYARLLARVGDDWELGRVSVAQEHYVAAFIRARLYPLLTLPTSPTIGIRRLVLACPAEERHDLGLLMLGVLLKLRGHSIVYLGGDLPLDEIDIGAFGGPVAVCLSIGRPSLVKDAIEHAGRWDIPVFLGGRGVRIHIAQNSDERRDGAVHFVTGTGEEAVAEIERGLAAWGVGRVGGL